MVACLTIALLMAAGNLARPTNSAAGCNIIPGTTKSFRGDLGTVDRPFASRDTWVEINVGSPCHFASPGFSDDPADYNVTIVFKAPSGVSNVVTLSPDCSALASALSTCNATASVQSVTCLDASIDLSPFDLDVLTRDGERNLRFRFPDTDALVGQGNDDVTLVGPAAIAVTGVADALPCGLATRTCAQQTGLTACVDELYDDSGDCSTVAHKMFTHFTALPPANSYQGLCTNPSPLCTGGVDEVRFAVDRDGNILLPMDWRGVLIGEGVPIARLLRGSTPLEPFSAGSGRIMIPGDDFLSSLSPEGGLLPPVFDPQFSASPQASTVLFGSTDATETVLRIARRSPTFTQCTDGAHDGLPCTVGADCPGGSCGPAVCVGGDNVGQGCMSDSDCPAGECGPSLFDFSDRLEAGVGPVVVRRHTNPTSSEQGVCEGGTEAGQSCNTDSACGSGACVRYSGEALDPVPLTGLAQTELISSFVVSESDAATDFNGDGDISDNVVTLKDRSSGVGQPLGAPQGCGMTADAEGRAVTLVQQPPFSFPAVAIAEDFLAILEAEAGQNQCDENQDGDTADAILRVFRLGQATAINDALSPPRAADPTPLVNGRALAISAGRLFVRSSESSGQADYNSNGSIGETVLEVMDLATGSMTTLCPSLDVATSHGNAAFLRPESSTGTSACPAGSLNADADLDDAVVYRWQGSGDAENTGRAATAVSISDQWMGAILSEAGDGAIDLNGDGDTLDGVAALNQLGDPATAWTNLTTAADTLELSGSVAVLITPESQQAATDLNGDGDTNDRVLQIYYAETGEMINVGQSAEEFVIGGGAVGFRTKESDQSTDLNGDGDMEDEIFQLFDLESRTLVNTRQTVMPCNLEACDPRMPYRVLNDTARFLSSESSEAKDLNGDGDTDDVVVRVFNIAMALQNPDLSTTVVTNGMRRFEGTMTFGNLVVAGMVTSVSSVRGESGRDIKGLVASLQTEDGALAYVNAGRCIEVFDKPCSVGAPCRSGEFCNSGGLCEREYGVCLGDQHCPPGARCEADLIAATAADSDGDELPDLFDNCPTVANVLQTDTNRDGIGDACTSSCGNRVRDAGEQCDAGISSNRAGQVCRPDCKLSVCGDPLAEGKTTVASALYVLRSAVGLSSCAACVCDLNGTDGTTASDALMAIKQAIGAGSMLMCPACEL